MPGSSPPPPPAPMSATRSTPPLAPPVPQVAATGSGGSKLWLVLGAVAFFGLAIVGGGGYFVWSRMKAPPAGPQTPGQVGAGQVVATNPTSPSQPTPVNPAPPTPSQTPPNTPSKPDEHRAAAAEPDGARAPTEPRRDPAPSRPEPVPNRVDPAPAPVPTRPAQRPPTAPHSQPADDSGRRARAGTGAADRRVGQRGSRDGHRSVAALRSAARRRVPAFARAGRTALGVARQGLGLQGRSRGPAATSCRTRATGC